MNGLRFGQLLLAAPALGRPIDARLRAAGIAMLGTLQRDGAPRVSPVEVMLIEGGLFIGMMAGSRKQADVLRDPRVSLLTAVADRNDLDGEGKLSGSLVSLDRHTAQAVLEAAGLDADAFADSPVFELRIDRAAWQQLDQATETWVSLVWDPTHGQRSFRRAGLGGERVPV